MQIDKLVFIIQMMLNILEKINLNLQNNIFLLNIKLEDNDEGNIQIQNNRKYTISYIIQTILAFIIIGVISIIILYVCYSYCKYKRKKTFKNIEYYQKQAEGLISNKFTG